MVHDREKDEGVNDTGKVSLMTVSIGWNAVQCRAPSDPLLAFPQCFIWFPSDAGRQAASSSLHSLRVPSSVVASSASSDRGLRPISTLQTADARNTDDAHVA